ncbi:MAG: N-acetylmuramoyl-L-alanine amidase [Coriobacteriia bacterium]|nr:N-acetylmuramoyl-L-alanine amidase [Coriobacteriia bacterium]
MMLQVQQRLTKTNFSSGSNRQIRFIVIHYVGAVSSALNNAIYFENTYRGASAHYFVDDGSIWQVVLDGDISWHAGATYYYSDARNTNSIGIEMCCFSDSGKLDVSAKTEANTIELVKHLMAKYNIPEANVIRHYDATRKMCPAPHVNDSKRWSAFKAALKGGTVVAPPPPASDTYPTLLIGSAGVHVKALQCLLNHQNGNSALLIDGDFGLVTDKAVRAFQRGRGLVVDGVAGAITLSALLTTVKQGSNSFAVRAAQHLISKFEPIVVDGFFGATTDSLVKTYQRMMGLEADGVIGQITWQSLFTKSAYPAAPPIAPPTKPDAKKLYRLLPKTAPVKDAWSADVIGSYEVLDNARTARDLKNPFAIYDEVGKETK